MKNRPTGDAEGTMKARARNPERTTQDILDAARDEFVEHGLEGARVDRIAARARANKRLIYHYIGNKEALYAEVLRHAYVDIRTGERALQLGDLGPREAMERLVGFTFDHFQANPWFIRLLSTENIHHAAYVAAIPEIRDMQSPIIAQIRSTLAAGEASGDFRTGVDPVQLYITIAGVSYFFFSNLKTLSVVFDAGLATAEGLERRRQHCIDVVLGYLVAKPLAGK